MTFARELRDQLKNVHTYAVTPFLASDTTQIDREGFAWNLEFLLRQGVRVIAVGGGTGEIEALSVDELELLARTALEVVGTKALVISCLPGNFRDATELARRYERLGAKIMLGMPPLIRGKIPADLSGVADFFQHISRVTPVPLMPYNTQGWPAEFFVQLAEIETIIGVKDPCHVPHEFFRAIQLLGDRFVWVGNKKHDPGVAHLRYQMGMEGFTSGQSNFYPEPELAIHEAAARKDWDEIIRIQRRIAPLEQLRLAHDDAAMVKAGMDLVGLTGGPVRPPRRNAPQEAGNALRQALETLGVGTKSARLA